MCILSSVDGPVCITTYAPAPLSLQNLNFALKSEASLIVNQKGCLIYRTKTASFPAEAQVPQHNAPNSMLQVEPRARSQATKDKLGSRKEQTCKAKKRNGEQVPRTPSKWLPLDLNT